MGVNYPMQLTADDEKYKVSNIWYSKGNQSEHSFVASLSIDQSLFLGTCTVLLANTARRILHLTLELWYGYCISQKEYEFVRHKRRTLCLKVHVPAQNLIIVLLIHYYVCWFVLCYFDVIYWVRLPLTYCIRSRSFPEITILFPDDNDHTSTS